MIFYLFLDILMTIGPLPTSFYLGYLSMSKIRWRNLPILIISLFIILFYTRNLFFLLTIPLIIVLKKYRYLGLSNRYLQYLINYLLFFNIHLSLENFLSFIISLLIMGGLNLKVLA